MQDIGRSYRDWVSQRHIDGFTTQIVDDDHVRAEGANAYAEVNFYEMGEDPEIVELRIEDTRNGETTFFLHFELEEEARAQDLFNEMAEALEATSQQETVHVLLCCTTGMTTSMFAARMNEVAKLISLDYDFAALPLEQALEQGVKYAAVLLAPQVGHRRTEVVTACPNAVVLSVPAKIFASYDAGAAVRLVMDALASTEAPAEHGKLRLKRDFDLSGKRIMLVSVINGTEPRCGCRLTSIGYRLLDNGEVTLEGEAQKRSFSYRDVEDVLSAAALMGADVCSLDAIAVSVPGTVNEGAVSMAALDLSDYPLEEHIRERYDIPVIIENNARAAAIGCYVCQDRFDTVTFHTQRTGAWVGGQGCVVDGKALRGKGAQSGELAPIARRLYSRPDATDAAWSPEGMCSLVADYLVANVCMLAPQAVYVACELVPDMDALREELAKDLPEQAIPELFAVDDYRERSYLGVLALSLQQLDEDKASK